MEAASIFQLTLLTTTFSNLMGVFSSDRLSLTLSGLTNDFEGTYTMTATNEAGSDSATVELVIEGQWYPSLCNAFSLRKLYVVHY